MNQQMGRWVLLAFLGGVLAWALWSIMTRPSEEETGRAEGAPASAEWAQVVEQAKGQTVHFYAWGGSEAINQYIAWVGQQVKARYGVTLEHVRLDDTAVAVNKIIGENQAGKHTGGSVDLIWINGANFATLKQANLLYGPVLPNLPNQAYLDPASPLVTHDFGLPTEGYEVPWGAAQFVMVYDSARTPQPPRSLPALVEWAKNNPGQFTYPQASSFIGMTFLKHLLYMAEGGPSTFQVPFDEATFARRATHYADVLADLTPHLWQQGQSYPPTQARLDEMLANGEVAFSMHFNPAEASSLIAQGLYPETVRTMVFDEGTIANTHFVALPYNGKSNAGAQVVANFLLGPEAQLEKANPEIWGDFTVLEMNRLPSDWQQQFANQPRGPATLPPAELAPKLPEPPAGWSEHLQRIWMR